jgi:hypothetical protein
LYIDSPFDNDALSKAETGRGPNLSRALCQADTAKSVCPMDRRRHPGLAKGRLGCRFKTRTALHVV